MDRSIKSRSGSFEESPIFMTRLVAESGWTMTGGADQLGRVGVTVAMRSCTSCRAVSRSVPGSKMSSIDDSCSTDLERITSRPGSPLRACSRGTVTSDSTSEEDNPREAVWISTRGGANSGKTSIGASRSVPAPKNISAAASPTTR
jgi:hypothetical protein